MAITLPSIEIIFKQLASTFITRSERGIAILIVRDDTNETFTSKTYNNLQELTYDQALYTAANYQYIADALGFAVNKVVVIRIDTTDTISVALSAIEGIVKTGWITIVGETADYTALVTWIKSKETAGETYKAVVYNAAAPDCKHVVNFINAKVTFSDSRGEVTGDEYLPSLAGILASCNVEKGSTYFKCTNLKTVEEVADNNAAVNSGKFILVNDLDIVKVGLGVNSLTTFNTTNVEDMRYIDNVEVMDLITDDVKSTFRNDYVGQYKNNLDNQILFISAVNTYFRALADSDILDPEYTNYSDVNITAQRAAWVAIKPEATGWDDTKVKNTTYKRNVFLAGDIKILGAMENLKFNITMF